MLKKSVAKSQMKIENFDYLPGEQIKGKIIIHGGEAGQNILSITVRLMMKVGINHGDVIKEVTSFPLELHAKEERVFPFSYVIPPNMPISGGAIHYYFESTVEMENGSERVVESIVILPNEPIYHVFRALGKLGFYEKGKLGQFDRFGQRFTFYPTERFVGQINEAKFRFAFEDSGIRVWLSVDAKIGREDVEVGREFFLERMIIDQEEKLVYHILGILEELISQTNDDQALSTPHHPSQISTPGMVGGLCGEILEEVLLKE